MTAILMGLVVLAGAAACPAEHLLDQAGEALSQGDAAGAVDMYRQANAELPTAEGYNNLGVALERSGRFVEAADAYEESLRLPHANEDAETNLNRARLRALIQAGLPYAVWVFGGLLVVFTLVWLTRRLVRAWRALRFRMRFRGVRVAGLAYRVQCRNGEYQPDAKVYGDSESISLKVDLALPQRRDIYPLQLELEVGGPNGGVWRTLQESVEATEADRVTIWFRVDELGELLEHSGTWKARLVLVNINKGLVGTTFAVVTRADLVADLEAVDARLIAVQGKQAGPEKVIFPDVEAVVPCAVIRPRSCHSSKFTGMHLRLDLVNVDKRDEVESQEFPLELDGGSMEFCSVSRPIAGDDIVRKVGRWEFRLSVEGRRLARIPFVIVSYEQALDSLKAESFAIAGFPRTGHAARVGSVAYLRNLRSLCPVMTVTTQFPSPRTRYRMTVGVCV
ncbi:MAG TPA: tetratricopeptide repeat protein, partial [Phycisphaerae bacterium]|nr:tetratricopeptide repeat protein [Phycisphaerae bacterium]